MIKNNAQAELIDAFTGKPVVLEVNWIDELKDHVRIDLTEVMSDEHEHPIVALKYTDLFSFMFTLGTKEQQAKMIPVREELGTEYMKTLHIRCTKDMKEGEEIVVNVKIHVPTIIEESIKKEAS